MKRRRARATAPGKTHARAKGGAPLHSWAPLPLRVSKPWTTFAQFVSRLSLRIKITGGFVLIVLASAAVGTIMGSRIVTEAMFNQTLKRVSTGMQAAHMVYQAELDRVRRAVVLAAASYRLAGVLGQGRFDGIAPLLADLQREQGLDYLTFVSPTKQRWTPTVSSDPSLGTARMAPVPDAAEKAWSGEPVVSTEVLTPAALEAESADLAARATIPVTAVPYAKQPSRSEVDAGLTMLAAAPVRVGGEIVGVMYGGLLLNRTTDLVDRCRRTVFGGELYQGKEAGAVTIFLDDVRVSTNVLLGSGQRAIGTQAQAEVAERVLQRGETWEGRAFVATDWYVANYEPLRDHAGRTIGMFYVGMKEGPYLAVRTNMMITFIFVVIAGALIVIALTYAVTRNMIHPLEEMVAASKRIAAGDFEQGVEVRSRDEIGHLASSFNKMLAAVKTMKQELEESARTLEERVQARTKELMAIQMQMAQSEKLASLGRMSSGVAHEINNPLGGILTFSMLALEDTRPDDPVRKNLEIIVKQTLRCRDIVKGLLEFSRKPEAVSATADVHSVIQSTLSLLEQQAIFHNIRTMRNFAPGLPPARVDPGQLQQVMMNLVLNALDAMEGCGMLTISTESQHGGKEVVIGVKDTGKGIPPEIQPLVFEPFFTTKEVGQGTGLGLAIVHGIVARAGGSIRLESSDTGTRFTIRLPAGDTRPPPSSAGLPGYVPPEE